MTCEVIFSIDVMLSDLCGILFVICYENILGKSGIVGQRLSASLVSIGCLSNYVHGAEWGHGDLGEQQNLIITC